MCVEEGCHMAAKYNTAFSWEQSKKYRSSQSGICVFNKKVPQILRNLWVQTKVMGVEPKGNPINFKCFLWRGDVGWQSGEMLCVLQIPDPLLAISLIAGCLLVAVQVTSVVSAPYPPGARAGVLAFLFCTVTSHQRGAGELGLLQLLLEPGRCGCGSKTWG